MPLIPMLERALIKRLQDHPSAACDYCDGDMRRNFCRRCQKSFWDGHASDCRALTVDKDLHHHDPECVRALEITYRQRFDADEIIC